MGQQASDDIELMKSLAMLYHGPVDLESYIYHYVNKQENQRYTANLDGNVCPIKAEIVEEMLKLELVQFSYQILLISVKQPAYQENWKLESSIE